jgi:hypothetical protein
MADVVGSTSPPHLLLPTPLPLEWGTAWVFGTLSKWHWARWIGFRDFPFCRALVCGSEDAALAEGAGCKANAHQQQSPPQLAALLYI